MNNIFLNFSFCILALSGFYLVFSESWTAAYRANVIAHAVLGIVVGFIFIAYYFLHYRKKTNAKLPLSFALPVFCLLLAGSAPPVILFPKVFLPVSLVAASLLAAGVTARILRSVTQRNVRISTWTGQALLFVWFLCFLTGVALIYAGGKEVLPRGYFLFHRYISYASVGVFLFHLLLPVAANRFYGLPYATRPYLRYLAEGLVIFCVGTVVFAVFLSVDSRIPVIRYHFELSTIIEERRESRLPPPLPPADAELLNHENTCGKTSGCHSNILDDHRISNHSRSIATPYFQKNLRDMKEEVGDRNILICAGCHYPTLMFRGDTDFGKYKDETSLSCVYCHVFDKVAFHPTDRRISYIDIKAPKPHLEMLRDAGGGRIAPLDAYLIKLNPLGHGRALTPPVIKTNDGCQACHALQIKSPESRGLPRPSCAKCHMQERYYLNLKGTEKNHFFPGTNTGLPFALGDLKTVKMVGDWLRGDLVIGVPDVTFWRLRTDSERKTAQKAFWLFLNIEPQGRIAAGEDFEFNVLTTNSGIDHSFPSAPLDLLEVWLEVIVKDSKGNTIFHSGYLDDENRIEPSAHTLGGYMIDEDHNILVENRVWAIKRKVVERLIQPGETATDRYSARLPADVGDAIHITARWNYRDLNQDFWEWGMDCADCAYPYSDVGIIEAELRVEPQR